MFFNLVDSEDFKNIMRVNIANVVSYLIDTQSEFGLLVDMKAVDFTPPLPEELQLRDPSYFVLAGYTLQTAEIEDDVLIFEAGFGEENFGSTVEVPLGSVLQVSLDDKAVLINLSTPPVQKPKQVVEQKEDGVNQSMNAFASNPENAKFFNK